MALASPLSFAGIAKELTRGVPVTPPTAFLPLKTITPEDVFKYLPVEVYQGSFPKVYGDVQGFRNITFEAAGPVFADTFGWPLFGVLGDVSFTASRSVTDGVTTLNSTTVTSATASFTSADVGKTIGNANIPAGAVIQSVTNGTTVVMSQQATASGTALTLVIGPTSWHVGNVNNNVSGSGQPTSHTLYDYYNATSARQLAGIQWHEVDIKFTSEGLLEHTSKATGLVGSVQVSKPTQSFTTIAPTPAWSGVVTIGGTVVSTVADGNVTITRTMELIPALTGSQQYQNVWIGMIEAKFKLSLIADASDTEYLRMAGNTQPSLDLNFTTGAGATAQQLVIHATKAAYEKAKINRSKQWVAWDVDGQLIGNTTDVGSTGGYGVCTLKLGNAVGSGTYQ